MLIKEQLETLPFSPAEQVVVTYLLEHPEEVEYRSIQELAQKNFTQPSTLIRIAKKMNYSGFKEFRKNYLEEWRYISKNFCQVDPNLPFQKKDSIMTITQKIAILEQSTIEDVQSLLHHDDLSLAKKMLLEADYIAIFARNENLLVSKAFAMKMNRIKKRTSVSDLKGEEGYEIHNLPDKSCALVISYSGEHESQLKVSNILQELHIPTIAITSIGENKLSKNCTCHLPIATREKLYSKIGNFTINTSINYLLDVLYALVFSAHYEENLAYLKKIGSLVDPRIMATNLVKETE